MCCFMQNGGGANDSAGRGSGHPSDNPFYSNIDSMPDIRPRRKSIPLVSELVSIFGLYGHFRYFYIFLQILFCLNLNVLFNIDFGH